MSHLFSTEMGKIVGMPGGGFWSQIHSFLPQEKEKREKRGNLLAILVLSHAPEGVEAVSAGREILGRLHEEYYGNLEGGAFERLQSAVGRVGKENENLEIVAAVLLENVLYLALNGKGRVLLKRGDKLGAIMERSEGIRSASGFLAEGDLLVLGSSCFFEVVGPGVLRAALENGSVDEAVEALTPIIWGRKDVGGAAAIFSLMKKEPELAITQVVSPAEEVAQKQTALPSFSLRKPFFVHRETVSRRKKVFFLLSLLLFTLLGGSLVFGFRRKITEKKTRQAQELLSQAETKLNQGKLLLESNPAEGRVLGATAQELADQAAALSGEKKEEAALIKEQAEIFLSSLGKEISLTAPLVFMDLGLVEDGGGGKSMSLTGKDLVILDSAKKKIYRLDTISKSPKVLDFPDGQGKQVIGAGKNLFVLAEKGVFATSDKSFTLKIAKDKSWGEINSLAFFGGNLYLLDKSKNVIWRYQASSAGFGTGKNWFVGNTPDLSSSTAMAIDGSIWVLFKDKVQKFTLGSEDNFTLSRMPEGLLNAVRIYTSDEIQNLYILDQGRGKIFVIAKTGEFKSSYNWEGFKTASDLVAVESLKKLFVLSGAKIYEVELK